MIQRRFAGTNCKPHKLLESTATLATMLCSAAFCFRIAAAY
jgi:hypothetical protein